jgi:hypothetical protein
MTISQTDINAVRAIIDRLNSRPALGAEEAQRRHRAYFERHFDTMLATGKTYGEVTGAPGTAVKTTDEKEFRAHLASIDNDPAEQARIVAEGIEHYFENGERPAPHYAWRLAIILRREKCYGLEADFLEAYSTKFPGTIGGRFKDIADRAPKARELAAGR